MPIKGGDIGLEQQVIGLLMRPDTDGGDVTYMVSALTDDCFTTPQTIAAWRAIEALIVSGAPFDEQSVHDKALDHLLMDIPNVSVLCAWSEGLPSTANARLHAGRLIQLAGARRLHSELIRQAELIAQSPGDPSVSRHAISTISKIEIRSDSALTTPEQDATQALNEWNRRLEGYGQDLKSKIKTFDNRVESTVSPGGVWAVGGRPGSGKTAFANCVALYNAIDGKSVFFASLELHTSRLIDRYVSIAASITNPHIRHPRSSLSAYPPGETETEIDAIRKAYRHIGQLSRLKNKRYGKAGMGDIVADASIHKARHGLDLLVIDYLQLINGHGGSQYERVTSISRDILSAAEELDCVIMAISQLRRAQPGKDNDEPTMADLRDSGQIEQDAHLITLLWDEDKDDGEINVTIPKNRDGAKGIQFNLAFEERMYRFS